MRILAVTLLALLAAGQLLAGDAGKDVPAVSPLGGPLAGLSQAREGTARQEGSWDRGGGNGDLRPVQPGETITLLDYNGAGIIKRFWCTIAPRADLSIHRQAILRMYWDGETTPSVEAPIGDFFGVGFGEQHDYISLPLNETSGGYNCYWPMPFRKSARWTLTNLSKTRLDSFYWNITFTGLEKLPRDQLYFHAQWRRENPTTPGRNYTILEARGRGHYVGTALFMQNRRGRGLGFLEGDEMLYIDGEEKPSIIGTGTEDYFSSGWYYDRGPYSAPYHGINIKDTRMGKVSTYRWHIEDALPFKKSLRFTIEHGHANDHEGDYSSVAYWYQTEPHAPFPALPKDPAALLPYVPPPPMRIPGAIEGEALLTGARITDGPIEAQDMSVFAGQWSDAGQLWWRPTKVDAALTVSVPAPEDGEYEITGHFTKARDYGRVQVFQGDAPIGAEVNLYDPEVRPSGPQPLGRARLRKGGNPLVFRINGRDPRSSGYMVGLDALVLRRL